MNKTNPSIHFFYPKGKYFTGQQAASELILLHLSGQLKFKPYHISTLNRKDKCKARSLLKYIFEAIRLWAYVFSLAFRNNIAVYLNFGQTWNSIFREGLPFICLKFFRKNIPMVISLHGHWFAKWDRASWKMHAFLKILSTAKFIVVLSDSQKQILIECGLKKESIKVIANTCDIEPLSNNLLKEKSLASTRIVVNNIILS